MQVPTVVSQVIQLALVHFVAHAAVTRPYPSIHAVQVVAAVHVLQLAEQATQRPLTKT